MYGCENWTIKKAEHWRIDTFELWCWRRPLRIPWTARRPNQSILKEMNPEYSLEGPMLKLTVLYFGHLMWGVDTLEKTLMLGKTESERRRGRQRMRWLDGITDSMAMTFSKPREIAEGRRGWSAAIHGVAKRWTWLGNWTAANRWQSSLPGQSGSAVLMQTACGPSSRQDGWAALVTGPQCAGAGGAPSPAGKLEGSMLYVGRLSSSFSVLQHPPRRKADVRLPLRKKMLQRVQSIIRNTVSCSPHFD